MSDLRAIRSMATGHYSLDLLSELPTRDCSMWDMIHAIRDFLRLMVQRGSHRSAISS